MLNNLKKAIRPLSIILTLLMVAFAFYYGNNLLENIKGQNISINPSLVILSFLLFGCFYGILSIHWWLACKAVDSSSRKTQVLAFFASQPYKYLPTSLFTFSFRASYAHKAGLNVKKSSVAQVLENASMITSGFLVGAIFILLQQSIAWFGLILILLLVYLLIPKQYNVRKFDLHFSKKQLSVMLLLSSLAWLVAGLSFYLICLSISDSVDLISAIASNSLAYISGILAFFSPGGVGIREVILALFSIPSSVVLLWRALTFVGDILLGLGAIIVFQFKVKNN